MADASWRHAGRPAYVLTISDRVAAGTAEDETGPAICERLRALGFNPGLEVAPDEPDAIRASVQGARPGSSLIVTNGGTGLSPRDVTPEALREILDYEIPGFGEAMRADGRRSTPHAILSRSLAGVYRGALVIALPGSPRAAVESLAAIEPVLAHALATLAGEAGRHPPPEGSAA
ncbi:MAG: MogA/MoaB family molybdenum cofactor biosynthesis protein [Chloroflexota bacterium]|nr:MogA/MoaB family molybdenum cofactor biosynthesis protein [Chloroflexota bacterium]